MVAAASVRLGAGPVWPSQRSLPLLGQVPLEQDDVARVGAEDGIGEVAEEGNEANEEVDDDVHHHLGLDRRRQTVVDVLAGSHDHQRHEQIQKVANSGKDRQHLDRSGGRHGGRLRGDDADETAHAELDAANVEAKIQDVRATSRLRQDLLVVLGDSRRKGLGLTFDLLGMIVAELAGGHALKVWILEGQVQ